MPGQCCQKSVTTTIRVGNFEAGILGFETIMRNAAAHEWTDEQSLAHHLLASAREHGNYISPSAEEMYRSALVREFKRFVGKGAQKK